nr:PREDICTED: ciliogenesis-associated TTC17-interacting protein [Latimeria chalumnae]|eukprot:XP_014351323.1 PREDICTED: ciliogenesis-associated TTC17-interacting protein [Latimeria chalumnae]
MDNLPVTSSTSQDAGKDVSTDEPALVSPKTSQEARRDVSTDEPALVSSKAGQEAGRDVSTDEPAPVTAKTSQEAGRDVSTDEPALMSPKVTEEPIKVLSMDNIALMSLRGSKESREHIRKTKSVPVGCRQQVLKDSSMGEAALMTSKSPPESRSDKLEEVVPVGLKANKEAIDFLASIEPEELQMCVFADSLVTVSHTGRELGEFAITIQLKQYCQEDCFLVYANSHGMIDDIPCGTSIMAYISMKLETLEQHHHEYVKEKKKQSFSFEWSSLEGFVSEAANLLILRVLARRGAVPENMVFLSFDTETRIATSTYKELGQWSQTIGNEMVEMYGIERTVQSEHDDEVPTTWQCAFLCDGHMATRVQVGSPITMKMLQLPVPVEPVEEAAAKPTFEKKSLNWEEDLQLYSRYLDRKEELKANHATYIRHHPELKALLSDFLQFLLLRKPHDIPTFAAEYFAPFASQSPPGPSFRSSNKSSPFRSSTLKKKKRKKLFMNNTDRHF